MHEYSEKKNKTVTSIRSASFPGVNIILIKNNAMVSQKLYYLLLKDIMHRTLYERIMVKHNISHLLEKGNLFKANYRSK